jgi:hypothetical protein
VEVCIKIKILKFTSFPTSMSTCAGSMAGWRRTGWRDQFAFSSIRSFSFPPGGYTPAVHSAIRLQQHVGVVRQRGFHRALFRDPDQQQ